MGDKVVFGEEVGEDDAVEVAVGVGVGEGGDGEGVGVGLGDGKVTSVVLTGCISG